MEHLPALQLLLRPPQQLRLHHLLLPPAPLPQEKKPRWGLLQPEAGKALAAAAAAVVVEEVVVVKWVAERE